MANTETSGSRVDVFHCGCGTAIPRIYPQIGNTPEGLPAYSADISLPDALNAFVMVKMHSQECAQLDLHLALSQLGLIQLLSSDKK